MGARLRERFSGVEVRSDLALTLGLLLAGLMLLVALVAAVIAAVRLAT